MIKQFTFTLPDEPYHTTTADNNTVNCTYNGPKWLCFAVENDTHKVRNLESEGNTEADLNFENQIEDGHYHIRVTANDHPMIAAYFTHAYTHEAIDDIEETLTDADGASFTFEYHYDDDGVIGQVCFNESVVWNPSNNTFSGPEFRTHVNSREETLSTFVAQADEYEANLASEDTDYTDADAAALTAHVAWLRSIPVKYAGIDHWKIPFPETLPILQ